MKKYSLHFQSNIINQYCLSIENNEIKYKQRRSPKFKKELIDTVLPS